MKIRTFVPLVTVAGGFAVLITDLIINGKVNESMFNSMIYAGLGASAVVGASKYIGAKIQ